MNFRKYFTSKAHSHLSKLKFGNISNYVYIVFFFFSCHGSLSKLIRKGLFKFYLEACVCVSKGESENILLGSFWKCTRIWALRSKSVCTT